MDTVYLTRVKDGSIMDSCRIALPPTIGYLRHEPTKMSWSVYSKVGWFKRLMLKWCFGLTYHKL